MHPSPKASVLHPKTQNAPPHCNLSKVCWQNVFYLTVYMPVDISVCFTIISPSRSLCNINNLSHLEKWVFFFFFYSAPCWKGALWLGLILCIIFVHVIFQKYNFSTHFFCGFCLSCFSLVWPEKVQHFDIYFRAYEEYLSCHTETKCKSYIPANRDTSKSYSLKTVLNVLTF